MADGTLSGLRNASVDLPGRSRLTEFRLRPDVSEEGSGSRQGPAPLGHQAYYIAGAAPARPCAPPSDPESAVRGVPARVQSIAPGRAAWPFPLAGWRRPVRLHRTARSGPRAAANSLRDVGVAADSGPAVPPETWPQSRRRQNAAGAAIRRCAPTADRTPENSTGRRPARTRLAYSPALADCPPSAYCAAV